MEEKDWLELLSGKNQLQKVIDMNQKTEKFGLALTEEEAKLLMNSRNPECSCRRKPGIVL